MEIFLQDDSGPFERLADRQKMPAIKDGLERPQLVIDAEDALAGLDLGFSQRRTLRRREFFDFRQMAYAGYAYVDDLDGILGKGVTIFALMGLMKARKNIIELRFCDDAVRKRDLEFVTLADIAQIAATHERHACRFEPIVGELFLSVATPSRRYRR